MKPAVPHILCVNPWIHDYAAFDFWARPLGLLGLASLLRKHGMTVSFLDCLDRFHPRQDPPLKVLADGRGPYRKTLIPPHPGLESVDRRFFRYGIDPDWFRQDLAAIDRPDLVLVTSLMTYWASGVAETIAVIKEVFPDVPVVLGGIYATLWPDHARRATLADQVVEGPGEDQLAGIVAAHTGYVFYPDHDSDNLDTLPVPALDLVSRLPYAPVLTSRGCPFACTYCASSFLEKKHRRRSPEAVFDEIKWLHQHHGVTTFAFYDDALLVDSARHALPLLEMIVASGMTLHFHTPNALHIREITQEAADLMFRAGFHTLRLGLETMDFSSSRNLDRKTAGADVAAAVGHLKQAGFSRDQAGAYLLCGLPGQAVRDVETSVLAVKSLGIQPVLAYYTPIPRTSMWEAAVACSRFDIEKDPVFSNNTLYPCLNSDTPEKTISQLKNLTK